MNQQTNQSEARRTWVRPNGRHTILDSYTEVQRRVQMFGGECLALAGTAPPLQSLIDRTEGRVTYTGDGGTHSAQAQARIEGENSKRDAVAKMLGHQRWATTKAVYPVGTRTVDMGAANFNTHWNELADQPLLVDELRSKADIIDAEQRRTLPMVPIHEFRLDVDAQSNVRIKRNGTGRAGVLVERSTVEHLLGMVQQGDPAFKGQREGILSGFDTDLAVEQFNRSIAKVQKGKRGHKRVVPIVRRLNGGEWSMMAVVSKRYDLSANAAQFARATAEALEGHGLRGTVGYNPTTTRMEFEGFAMPDTVVDLAAGDVFKQGVRGWTDDAKGSSLNLHAIAIRNLCLNLIITSDELMTVVKERHVGRGKLARALRQGLPKLDRAVDMLLDIWGKGRSIMLAQAMDGDPDQPDIDQLLGFASEFKPRGMDPDAWTKAITTAADIERFDGSVTSAANTVTWVHNLLDSINEWDLARMVGDRQAELVRVAQ